MAKPEQLLQIEPETELKFRGPFNVSVMSYMRLTNPTDKKILFKIKTTAPKKYCVRPNSGALDPKHTIEVAIALQPFVFDPNEKNKHKFMVQSLVAPEGDFDADRLWKEVTPEQLMDSKLKCVFEVPVDNNTVIDLSSSNINQTGGKTEAPVVKQETAQLNATEDKTFAKSTSGDIHADYARTVAEIQKLREEESQLRMENIELKEQILKLKLQSNTGSSGSHHQPAPQNPYAPQHIAANQQLSPMYIAAAIAIAILGLLLGKFAL
ncbi:vesicle-associated membrane protein-associated protein B isoform X2 [Culicoides brevitarsis]|uniref:vesicle-associated membrane protein-associated protein B isoform X2 n=1 Tax=Culicoides brevitarsis TaxID=469753 RepID=UPI00307C4F55